MRLFVNSPKFYILIVTALLFSMSYWFGISIIIIDTLSFLILMEIVRTIWDYIDNPEHRVKVRYIIDGGILFTIRELFVGLLMMKTSLELALVIVLIAIIVMGSLIFFRHKVILSSPDVIEKKE